MGSAEERRGLQGLPLQPARYGWRRAALLHIERCPQKPAHAARVAELVAIRNSGQVEDERVDWA
jgi:hypothetical protein